MRRLTVLLSALLLSTGVLARADSGPAPPVHPLTLEFHSAFLMNLHSFLLDAATRQPQLSSYPWVQKPSDADTRALRDAIGFYVANYAKRNLLFDDVMTSIKKTLSTTDGRRDVKGLHLPPGLADVLARAAPIYARCLWPAHDRSNREWIRQVKLLNAQYGADVQVGIERYMGHPFQQTRIREDIVMLTGSRNGGYTDTQTVLPSGREDYRGLAALEMLYHEAAHIEVDDTVLNEIEAELKATHRSLHSDLWHAVAFYTVGETVQEVLKRRANLDYETYADRNGVYTRGDWPLFHAAIISAWRPYMNGSTTRQEAIKAMVSQLPAGPPARG
jgi:hypothetical protein